MRFRIFNNLLIIVIMLLSSTLVAFADLQSDQEFADQMQSLREQLTRVIDSDPNLERCRELLTPLYDVEIAEFYKFLDGTFKNKSSNSSLINITIARYSEYKRAINKHFNKLKPQSDALYGGVEEINELKKFQECSQITDQYTQLGKEQMIKHIRTSTLQKKSTIFVEKYQGINDKMRSLNLDIAQTFGYFMTFNNKLPGFLNECVAAN